MSGRKRDRFDEMSAQELLKADAVLSGACLDLLMPMHLWVGPTGHIVRAGPTLLKIRPDDDVVGQRVTEFLEFRRPRDVQVLNDLASNKGLSVQAVFRAGLRHSVKGTVVPLAEGQGVLLNLSLGITVAEMVGRFGLKAKDFAASDPTVEMLYLIEAQSAILKESKKLNARLEGARVAAEEQATTDMLTGLKNRRALDIILDQSVEAAHDVGFGLMNVDLDYFKSVNDTYGHAAGDFVLQAAAKILLEETRANDIVARIGGDEFALILSDCDDAKLMGRIARRIIARLEKPICYEGIECRISASIGITLSSQYAVLSADQIASDADAALYASKHKGRACHTFFGDESEVCAPCL